MCKFQDIDITTLIPQRRPFVMVDRVERSEEKDTFTSFLVREDCLFVDDGQLSSSGLIENMAQSCGARMGCIGLVLNTPVRKGVICDIRDCQLLRQPQCGERLQTQVHIIQEVFNLTMADVSVRVGTELVASAIMKIALSEA